MIFSQVKIGGGGYMTGIAAASDGTIVTRTDVFGAYLLNTATSTWQQLVSSTSVPVGSIFAGSTGAAEIQIASSNTSILYMYWVDSVYRSTDKGATWTKTNFSAVSFTGNSGSTKNFGPFIGIKSTDPNTVLVATPTNGVFKTTDGNNFSAVSAVGNGGGSGQIIAWDPNTVGTVYVGTPGTGVYKSTDSGVTWALTTSGPTSMYWMVCAADGTIFVTDGVNAKVWIYNGTSWSSTATSITPSGIALNPTTSGSSLQVVIIANGGQMQVSNNKGVSFPISAAPTYASRTVPWLTGTFGFASNNAMAFDPSGLLYLTSGVGIWTTTPPAGAGYTATELTQGIENMVANQVISPPSVNPLFMVWDKMFCQANGTAYPSGCGPFNPLDTTIVATWSGDYAKSSPSTIVTLSNFSATDFSSVSSNGGTSWSQWANFLPSSINGGTIAASTPTNWAAIQPTSAGQLYVTQNGASSPWTIPTISGVATSGNIGWGATGLGGYRTVLCADASSGTFFAYNYGGSSTAGLYETTNGGTSWTRPFTGNIDAGGNDQGNSTLACVPGQAGDLFYSSGNTMASNLPFYEWNGSGWNAVANVTNVITFGFGKAKPGNSYPSIYVYGKVSGVLGLYRSDDHAVTWTLLAIYPNGVIDFAHTVSGDMNTYGTVYIGYAGSSYIKGVLN